MSHNQLRQATPRIWGTCEPVPKPPDGNPETLYRIPVWKTVQQFEEDIRLNVSNLKKKTETCFLGRSSCKMFPILI